MRPYQTLRRLALYSNSIFNHHNPTINTHFLCPTTLKRTMASAMAQRLEGKTIVITGASSGIGRSTAKEFAKTSPKNLKLVVTARRIDALKGLAEEIKTEVGEGVKVLPVKLDVSKPDEVKGFVEGLPEEFREIDVLVNNAYVFSTTARTARNRPPNTLC